METMLQLVFLFVLLNVDDHGLVDMSFDIGRNVQER